MSAVKMLTMTEAAHELGPDFYEGHESNLDEWMRRRLRAREAELRMKILVREGRRYMVARPTLLVAYAERTKHHDKVATATGKKIGSALEAIRRVDNRLDDIEGNIAALAEAYRGLLARYNARVK